MSKGPIYGPTLPPTAVRAPHLSAHMLCMTERPTPRTRDDFPEILLTRQEAATYLGLSKAWLAKMACRGIGPAYYKLPGGTVRYDLEALREWAGVSGKKVA